MSAASSRSSRRFAARVPIRPSHPQSRQKRPSRVAQLRLSPRTLVRPSILVMPTRLVRMLANMQRLAGGAEVAVLALSPAVRVPRVVEVKLRRRPAPVAANSQVPGLNGVDVIRDGVLQPGDALGEAGVVVKNLGGRDGVAGLPADLQGLPLAHERKATAACGRSASILLQCFQIAFAPLPGSWPHDAVKRRAMMLGGFRASGGGRI